MIPPFTSDPVGPSERQAGQLALASAIAIRDCSLTKRSTGPKTRANRTLMREEALKWRNATASGR